MLYSPSGTFFMKCKQFNESELVFFCKSLVSSKQKNNVGPKYKIILNMDSGSQIPKLILNPDL
jgi:hypothetical protein